LSVSKTEQAARLAASASSANREMVFNVIFLLGILGSIGAPRRPQLQGAVRNKRLPVVADGTVRLGVNP
jgi:hypothetical protein